MYKVGAERKARIDGSGTFVRETSSARISPEGHGEAFGEDGQVS